MRVQRKDVLKLRLSSSIPRYSDVYKLTIHPRGMKKQSLGCAPLAEIYCTDILHRSRRHEPNIAGSQNIDLALPSGTLSLLRLLFLV